MDAAFSKYHITIAVALQIEDNFVMYVLVNCITKTKIAPSTAVY